MASIQRKRKKDGTYSYYVVTKIGNKLVWKWAGNTKRAAKKVLAEKEYEMLHGIILDSENIKFKQLYGMFIDYCHESDLKPRTINFYEAYIENYLLPYFGDYKVGDIRVLHCRMFLKHLIDNDVISNQTKNHCLRVLKNILNRAVEWEIIIRNPAKNIRLLKVDGLEITVLTPEQIFSLIDCCHKEPYKTFIATACFTGMRAGELLGLQFKDIDLNKNVIHVRRQYNYSYGYQTTKNNEIRDIPIPIVLNNLLQQYIQNYRFSVLDDSPVFAIREETPILRYEKPFKKTLMEAGLPDIRFHDLRHTYCSLMRSKGASSIEVQKIIGHKTQIMTDHYTHVYPESIKKVAELLDEVFDSNADNKDEEDNKDLNS